MTTTSTTAPAGDGQQQTTAPAGDGQQQTAPTAAEIAADRDKWKDIARKHEERAKANAQAAKDLEQLRSQSMTETERAVATAKAEARAEALREAAGRVVEAELRAAAAGRSVDVDALLEGVDRSRFITTDGDADRAAIKAWIDKVAPAAPQGPAPGPGFPDLGQGARKQAAALNGDPLLADLKSVLGIR